MTQRERQAWLMVGSLFVTMVFVFGSGMNTAGVFVIPLIRQFGWNRTRVSLLSTGQLATRGLSVPPLGWAMDRADLRAIMTLGAILSAFSFILASRANSFAPMFLAYLLLGIGVDASTLLPCSLLIARWFKENRGLALGIATAGLAAGSMLMTPVADYATAAYSWRVGFLVLAFPILIFVTPLLIFVVRSYPPDEMPARRAGVRQPVAHEGLGIGAALRTRAFWMIVAAQNCSSFVLTVLTVHFIPSLIGMGYRTGTAAWVMSFVLGLGAVGMPAMGLLADRIGGHVALAVNFAIQSVGMLLFFKLETPLFLFPFVLLVGITVQSSGTALLPLVTASSLGLKNYGLLYGLTRLCGLVGGVIGPVVAGAIFDVTGTYTRAFWLLVMVSTIAVGASLLATPLEVEDKRLERLAVASEKR